MSFPPPTRMVRLTVLAVVALSTVPVAIPPSAMTGSGAVDVAGTTHLAATHQDVRWSWPVDGARRIVTPYRAPATAYSAGHRGIDVAAHVDQHVIAVGDGIVHFAGWVVDRPVMSINHGGGLISSLEPVATELTIGDTVRAGQVIGAVTADAAHCSATCLHLGARQDGQYVSPLLFLGGIPRSVLLPLGPS